ncbi:hypothetical protein JNUCC0626_50150 (plasmid) [Lentzea sp. JNUCC 0626]|uniref:hypothetical protein n=1 Tax=Lentzea sp. JNUCC 0626 TaxID=3367513 RepID=UPI003747C3FD
MTAATSYPDVVAPVQRPECVSCTRPMGRRRTPLINDEPLYVCDLCWHLAGGAQAVAAKLAGEQPQPLLELDPGAEALMLAVAEQDQLHPLDRLLTMSGIRWAVLRQIVPAARVDLAGRVLNRIAPEHTRPAQGAATWMEAVEQQIRDSTEFRYKAKQRRWWRIARVFAICADRTGRPLTWVSQEEIAAAVGCSDRTVRRCVRWLQQVGLLWEVVPGCRLPMMEVPEGETPSEREARLKRRAAALAAEEAARTNARCEVDAVRAGRRGLAAVAAAAAARPKQPLISEDGDDEAPKVNLVPVYELRVQLSPDEKTEADSIVQAYAQQRTPGELVAQRNLDRLVHPRNAHLYQELVAIGHDGTQVVLDALEATDALTCGYAVALMRLDKNGHPPQVGSVDQLKSNYVRPVDNRRASRGCDEERAPSPEDGPDSFADEQTGVPESDRKRKRPSRAQRAAERLLRSLLRPEVCEGVSIRWLTARLRGSRLLDAGWTEQDLADHIHGLPEFSQLPHHIRSCRSWINARLARAIPHLPPSKQYEIAKVEGVEADARRAARQAAVARSRREEIAARREAIDECVLCDELGWLHIPDDGPTVRCSHDLEAGGW